VAPSNLTKASRPGGVVAARIGLIVLVAIALVGAPSVSIGGQATPRSYAGRAVADVLKELQAANLKIIFSAERVPPTLRVLREPSGSWATAVADGDCGSSGCRDRQRRCLAVDEPSSPAGRTPRDRNGSDSRRHRSHRGCRQSPGDGGDRRHDQPTQGRGSCRGGGTESRVVPVARRHLRPSGR
jgi:hypothetical protein